MPAPGRIRLQTRSAFTSILEANVHKYEGQEEIPMVAGLDNSLAERIVSRPTTGNRQVFNIYWDTSLEELVIEISEVDA